jgi:hypothetical protein
LRGADPIVVTGSITGPVPFFIQHDSYGCAIQLQGLNLSLTAVHSNGCQSPSIQLGSSTAILSVPGSEVFTVASSTPGESASVTYNGVTYGNVVVDLQMSLTGGQVTIPITTYPQPGTSAPAEQASGSLPFTSMTGTLSVYSSGGLIFSVPIAGVGVYSASVSVTQPYISLGEGFYFTAGASPTGPSLLLDAGTQGAWNGAYGADGYFIANGESQAPSYANVGFGGISTYSWAGATQDTRALQNGAGVTERIASTYLAPGYGNSFSIPVEFSDGLAHRVALYLLDWDTQNVRTETITLTDQKTGTVIDSENFSNFSNGEYAVWDLSGAFTVTVTATGFGGPVLSGIFFGSAGNYAAPAAPSSSASFVNSGGGNGLWNGLFGANGFLLANDPYSMNPAYATVRVQGAFPYTWASQLNPIQGLQLYPGTDVSLASAYTQYQSQSFQIHVNVVDGNTHSISLCLFDFDHQGRVETVTVSDGFTGAVLDTETFQSFQSPTFATWLISGNVIFTVSPVGATSPVVSGIFFN